MGPLQGRAGGSLILRSTEVLGAAWSPPVAWPRHRPLAAIGLLRGKPMAFEQRGLRVFPHHLGIEPLMPNTAGWRQGMDAPDRNPNDNMREGIPRLEQTCGLLDRAPPPTTSPGVVSRLLFKHRGWGRGSGETQPPRGGGFNDFKKKLGPERGTV